MNHALRVALCHSATARAHLAGAEAAELDARAGTIEDAATGANEIGAMIYCLGAALVREQARAARRRYWRELAAVQLLMGHPWPEAETLGVEP